MAQTKRTPYLICGQPLVIARLEATGSQIGDGPVDQQSFPTGPLPVSRRHEDDLAHPCAFHRAVTRRQSRVTFSRADALEKVTRDCRRVTARWKAHGWARSSSCRLETGNGPVGNDC